MKGDIPAPALRLMSTAPRVVTHEQRNYASIQGSKNCKPIKIGGRVYKSINDIKQRLRIGTNKIYEWHRERILREKKKGNAFSQNRVDFNLRAIAAKHGDKAAQEAAKEFGSK